MGGMRSFQVKKIEVCYFAFRRFTSIDAHGVIFDVFLFGILIHFSPPLVYITVR
jgi:hypothetical protein